MRVAPLVGVPPPPAGIEPGLAALAPACRSRYRRHALSDRAGCARAASARGRRLSGSAFEPLGALRRALARSMTRELSPLLLELADPLESLLAGDGVSLDVAARLVTAFLWPKTEGQGPGLLLLDDAKSVDPATLEACVRAARARRRRRSASSRGSMRRAACPRCSPRCRKSSEIEIAPLSRDAAESLAGGCTNDALDDMARRRWARLAANIPLGVVESDRVRHRDRRAALARRQGLAALARVGSRQGARRCRVDPPARARREPGMSRGALCLIAMLGGEAKVTRLANVLERAGDDIDLEEVLEELIRGRWLVDTQEDWVALPVAHASRGARAAARRRGATTASSCVGRGRSRRRRASSAASRRHGTRRRSGDGPAAARILLAAARGTAEARLEASTTQLIAFARRADPSCEEAAIELLANALERAPSVPPPQSTIAPPPHVR